MYFSAYPHTIFYNLHCFVHWFPQRCWMHFRKFIKTLFVKTVGLRIMYVYIYIHIYTYIYIYVANYIKLQSSFTITYFNYNTCSYVDIPSWLKLMPFNYMDYGLTPCTAPSMYGSGSLSGCVYDDIQFACFSKLPFPSNYTKILLYIMLTMYIVVVRWTLKYSYRFDLIIKFSLWQSAKAFFSPRGHYKQNNTTTTKTNNIQHDKIQECE